MSTVAETYYPINEDEDEELTPDSHIEIAFPTTPFIPVQKRRSNKHIELHETNDQVNALSMLNVLSDKQKKDSEDDCDLYGRLIAKKLRQYSESDRQELMYEIDGLLLKRKHDLSTRHNVPSFPNPSSHRLTNNRPAQNSSNSFATNHSNLSNTPSTLSPESSQSQDLSPPPLDEPSYVPPGKSEKSPRNSGSGNPESVTI